MAHPAWEFNDVCLEDDFVRIETLREEHFDGTCSSLLPDPEGWYSRMFGLDSPAAIREEFRDADRLRRERSGMGFAIFDARSGQAAGITSYLRMDRENRGLEIGTTIVAPRFRRSHVNFSSKRLLMRRAFGDLGCVRVSFRIDEENSVSRAAIERLGAIPSGTLRAERILPDGRVRNYVFYSVLRDEWPDVERNLSARLAKMG